jgi:flagellar hook assembly protein FlgD
MSVVRRCVIVLGVAAAFLPASIFAADANAASKKSPKLKGTISVTKDPNNVVTAIKLTTTNNTVYYVTLDEKGKELVSLNGKEVNARANGETHGIIIIGGLNGKEVKIRGVVTEQNGQKWIKVQEYQTVEKKTRPTKGTKQ